MFLEWVIPIAVLIFSKYYLFFLVNMRKKQREQIPKKPAHLFSEAEAAAAAAAAQAAAAFESPTSNRP